MTDAEKTELEALKAEYLQLGHAVQTGVAFHMNHNSNFTSPKHLRVGIDLSKSDMGGLAHLLIEKGFITELEYMRAIVEFARREVASYEQIAKDITGGADIKFG